MRQVLLLDTVNNVTMNQALTSEDERYEWIEQVKAHRRKGSQAQRDAARVTLLRSCGGGTPPGQPAGRRRSTLQPPWGRA